jgi:hypothetical protein
LLALILRLPKFAKGRTHVPGANESARNLRSDIPESRKNRAIEFKSGFWLIAACTCEYLEALSRGLLDGFKVVYLDDQVGRLGISERKLFISHVFCLGIDPDFGWKVPGDFGALPGQFKVAWLAGFCHSATLLLPDCEEVAAEGTVPFVRHLPGADSRFDAPKELSLKLQLKLSGEQSSDGESFYYRGCDSLRDLTVKFSVCSIAKTGVCLIDSTGSGKAGQEDSQDAGQDFPTFQYNWAFCILVFSDRMEFHVDNC